MIQKYIKRMILIAAFAVVGMAFTSSAASAYYGGYCGSPVTSKSEMISFYKSAEGKALSLGTESYVRANASYYHIQSDQGFMTWLEMPNVKYFRAPAGYTLTSNTYCPGNEPKPFHGHYGVGGKYMLWWCNNPSGGGHECVPITKGYCRNFVKGPRIRKQQKARHHNVHRKSVEQLKTTSTCEGTVKVVVGQAVCQTQSNSNTTSQSGTTSGQGSPVINVNNTTQVNVQQSQGQQQAGQQHQEQTQTTPPPAKEEKPAPKEPSIVITSITALNQIEEGRSSPVHIKVIASESGGSLTVDPGIGSSSKCESTTVEESTTFNGLPAGESNLCVTIYAPSDASKPESMEMSATAVLGNSVSFAFQIFEITYPTRPS